MTQRFLDGIVQLYTTVRCSMNCPHCSSRGQFVPDMGLETFQAVLERTPAIGAERIELFANDPLLHPQIQRQVALLNKSGLEYALLTVGASPVDPTVEKRFLEVAGKIDPEKGGIVFSVDFGRETSERIVREGINNSLFPYCFKARVFWRLAPLLKAAGIPVRTNTVISRHNINEVVPIIDSVVRMGFTASFCSVQYEQPDFKRLVRDGLTPELEQRFRFYLEGSGLLSNVEINRIVVQAREIAARGEWGSFNTFRGSDQTEGEFSEVDLRQLRQKILQVKHAFGEKVLPGEDFIGEIGQSGFGCIRLVQQGRFPQMKIGSLGQMIFCCDLHDPITQRYNIIQMQGQTVPAFLETIRTNPYIWLCACFNPCDFSVNRVSYGIKT